MGKKFTDSVETKGKQERNKHHKEVIKMRKYANHFKIKAYNHTGDLKGLVNAYGGVIETDARLWPNEYWYHTDIDRKTLEDSGLIKVLDSTHNSI